MSDASPPSTAAPPADRAHDETAEAKAHAHADAHAHGRQPHGPGGDPPRAHVAHHFHSLSQQFAVEKLGIWLFLATEILMFGGLFCAYAFYRGLHPEIFLYGHQFLPTHWGAINTAVLLTSSLTMAWGVRAAQLNQRGVLKFMLIATFMGGVGFMVIKGIEYQSKFSHDLGPGPANLFYPVPEADPNYDQLQAEKLDEIDHLEAYYGLTGHGTGHEHGHGDAAAHGDEAARTDEQAIAEVQADTAATDEPGRPGGDPAADARLADRVAAGETGDAESQPAAGNPMVSADLPPAEQSAVAAPMRPTGGVNPAMLDAAADHDDHKTYTYAQLPEIEQSRMHMFFQIYFLMTGLHGIHVLVGMGLIGWLIVRAFQGAFSPVNFTAVDVVGLYWHLVDLIWIFLFPLLYLIH